MQFGLSFERHPDVVRRELTKLSIDLERRGIVDGLREIAKPMARHMRKNAPYRTGALRKSIGYRTLRKRASDELTAGVGAGVRVGVVRWVADAGYSLSPEKKISQEFKAYWFEYTGTGKHFSGSPYMIKPKKGGGKNALAFGGHIVSAVKKHPGMRRRPFIEPAYQAYEGRMDELFARGIDQFFARR